jgi:hypothetical protein
MVERISPMWLGISISGVLLVVLLASETLLGRWDEILVGGELDPLAKVTSGALRDIRIAIVHCLEIGYLPAAFMYVLQSGRRTVLGLQGALDCTRKECEALAASLRLSRRGLVITGAIGFTFALLTPYLVPPVLPSPWNPSTWGPEVTWHRILNPMTSVWSWWLGYAVVIVSVRMSRIAKKLNHLNLLDLSPLAPFTQQGLTNVLLLIGSLSIWSLMMFETGFGQLLMIIGVATLISTAFALIMPVRGVHERIQQSKDAELYWVNSKISEQRDVLQNPNTSRPGSGMADLIAYKQLVEGVPEWPFTKSTYTRVVLYTLLPLVSWGIGIIAEEIVARALF